MVKKSPQSQKLEQMLRSSKIVAGGFMGDDIRSVDEIIDADLAELAATGKTPAELAGRMQEITDAAKTGLGTWVTIDDSINAMIEEAKGFLVCPFAHQGRFAKRVTIVTNNKTQESIQWSDLNIHLIEQHGFFEGAGSAFRLEPRKLVKFLFSND